MKLPNISLQTTCIEIPTKRDITLTKFELFKDTEYYNSYTVFFRG